MNTMLKLIRNILQNKIIEYLLDNYRDESKFDYNDIINLMEDTSIISQYQWIYQSDGPQNLLDVYLRRFLQKIKKKCLLLR